MWFKNLQLYRFSSPFEYTSEELEALLEPEAFRPCGKHEVSQYGWVSPMGDHSEMFCHSSNGFLMLCSRKEEKVLPATVIRELVDEKVALIEQDQDRKVYRKEKDSLKEEILFECMPRAFSRSSRTYAYIDPKGGWLVVDAASSKKAEELTSYLRQTLGSLPLAPPQVSDSPSIIMTQWLRGESLPSDIELGDECELREAGEEGSIIRCKRQDLTGEEITAHLDAGKQAYKLAVEWDENLNYILNEDLSIKRLRFSDALIAEGEDSGAEDAAAKFDADFTLMSMTLARLLPRLLEHFGGEKISV